MVSFVDAGGQSHLPLSGVKGLARTYRLVHYSSGAAILLVNFRDGGAAAFLDAPMNEFFGTYVSLDGVMNQARVQELEGKLFHSGTDPQKVSRVADFLVSSLRQPPMDSLVLETVRAMKSFGGRVRIRDLTRELTIKRGLLREKIQPVIGTSPKRYASILRLLELITRYTPGTSYTEAALAAGFFDQAHFINDFKAFTGKTPRDFFRTPTLCCLPSRS